MRRMVDVAVKFGRDGLIPVVVQDHLTGDIRMFAHATIEAVRATLESGRATFWSRSRNELWEKGLTSGNVLEVRGVIVDCDEDCLIYSAEPLGATCHTGAPSCFFQTLERDGAPPAAWRDAADRPRAARGADRRSQSEHRGAELHEVAVRRRGGGDRREAPRGSGRARPGDRERERRARRERSGGRRSTTCWSPSARET